MAVPADADGGPAAVLCADAGAEALVRADAVGDSADADGGAMAVLRADAEADADAGADAGPDADADADAELCADSEPRDG
ncbi:hypothetical protein [Streptomyces sp. NPDC048111]|uniref:hypothetical protein n=1 Tax=Streptomyces sp. NPDC048111 TaxID=3365500 RepID=UPI003713054F